MIRNTNAVCGSDLIILSSRLLCTCRYRATSLQYDLFGSFET